MFVEVFMFFFFYSSFSLALILISISISLRRSFHHRNIVVNIIWSGSSACLSMICRRFYLSWLLFFFFFCVYCHFAFIFAWIRRQRHNQIKKNSTKHRPKRLKIIHAKCCKNTEDLQLNPLHTQSDWPDPILAAPLTQISSNKFINFVLKENLVNHMRPCSERTCQLNSLMDGGKYTFSIANNLGTNFLRLRVHKYIKNDDGFHSFTAKYRWKLYFLWPGDSATRSHGFNHSNIPRSINVCDSVWKMKTIRAKIWTY